MGGATRSTLRFAHRRQGPGVAETNAREVDAQKRRLAGKMRKAPRAGGHGDACLSGYGRAEWDVAAGVVLCKAAGFRVTDVLGHPMRFNQPDPYVAGLLIAKPALHGVLDQWFRRLR